MGARNERHQELIDSISEEVSSYETSLVQARPRPTEIAKRHGYSTHTIEIIFWREKFGSRLRLATQERARRTLEPSSNLAWLLGFLSGGGNVDCRAGRIRSIGKRKQVREKFSRLGSQVFQIDAKQGVHKSKNYVSPQVTFSSHALAREIGDLGRNKFPQTIQKQYKWISGDQSYIWQFIEGFFEANGEIPKNAHPMVILNSNFLTANRFFMELVHLVGISYPTPRWKTNTPEGVRGLQISNPKDLVTFSRNVHSADPIIEKKLASFRLVYNRAV